MIGAGFIGQLAHLMNLVEVERCRVTALAEARPLLRQQVAVRYGIDRTYETHEQLLKDDAVDAVVVATARPYTGQIVLDCLNAGKHVLSEKPMAGTVEQGQRLVETAKAHSMHYAVGYMKRYDEGVQEAKRILDGLIESGELGPVVFARAHCYMGDSYCNAGGHVVTDERAPEVSDHWPVAPDWLPKARELDFAAFVNTYSHNTNLLRYLFGQTPTVEAVHFGNMGGRVAILNFGEFVATLETGRSSSRGWDEVTEVHFADGSLTLKTPPALLKNVPAVVELYKAGDIQQISSPQCGWTWAFRRQSEAFVADILDRRASTASGADALEELRLHEAMWRMEIGRTS